MTENLVVWYYCRNCGWEFRPPYTCACGGRVKS